MFGNLFGGGMSGGGGMGGGGMGGLFQGIGEIFGSMSDNRAAKRAASRMQAGYQALLPKTLEDSDRATRMADPFGPYRNQYAATLDKILGGQIDFTKPAMIRVRDPKEDENLGYNYTEPVVHHASLDPGWQFRIDQATEAAERAGAARGYNQSGNILNAIQETAQEQASVEYNNMINRLIGLAGATPQNAVAGATTFADTRKNYYDAFQGMFSARADKGGVSSGNVARAVGNTVGSLFGG